MARVGHGGRALLATGALLGVACAAAPALWMRGFTVDDALIAVRYARHVAEGLGYRFNVGGPPTDGVTPLPWPFLLAPMAHADALTVLARATWLGALAWLAAAAAWGAAVARTPAAPEAKAIAFATLALSVPVAAYAVSGMETPVAIALATLASVSTSRPLLAAALAGLAAAFRPELGAWALTVAAGLAIARGMRARAIFAAGLALVPFTVCAIARALAFGRPAPLAVLAKPSDLAHGALYAGAALVVSLAPLLALSAPRALARGPRPALVLALAAVVHFAAIVAVGGDWMPYARLAAPIVPSLLYAFVVASPAAHRLATLARGALVVGLAITLVATGGTSGRSVGPEREALIASARPVLAPARHVAALDVGWVSAATEADIVDLAGLTDPAFAALPGGHTSKQLDAAMLLDRGVDAIVVYTTRPSDDWRRSTFARVTDARIAKSDLLAERFALRAFLPLGGRGAGYFILLRRD